MKFANCQDCGEPFEYDEEFAVGGFAPVRCETCLSAYETKLAREMEQASSSREWIRICPEIFRHSSFDMLPLPERTETALGWDYGAKGLVLYGSPRMGKTRTMFMLLRKVHFDYRKSITVFGPGDFARGCEAREYKTGFWIKRLQAVDVLAIDEIDKMSLTKHQHTLFFSVINKRTEDGKPIICTGNSNGDRLELLFPHGKALVARLREFCRPIYFG